MTKPNGVLVAMMIAGLIAGGCSSSAPVIDPTICEYPPSKLPSQTTVDEAGVFALVQWPTTKPSSLGPEKDSGDPATEYIPAKELESDVCVDRGDSIGFRVEHNQLLALAGKTTIALEDGHYSWILISSPPNGKRQSDFGQAVWDATIGAVVGGLIWAWTRIGSPF